MAFTLRHLVLITSTVLCMTVLGVVIFYSKHPIWSRKARDIDPVMAKLAQSQLEKQAQDFWNWRLEDDPEFATSANVHIYNDRLENQSVQAYEGRLNKCKQFLSHLREVSYFRNHFIFG